MKKRKSKWALGQLTLLVFCTPIKIRGMKRGRSMEFVIKGRVIKTMKTKAGKPMANVLVEGKNGAADVVMLFSEKELSVGQAFEGVIDAQVQFAREVVGGKK